MRVLLHRISRKRRLLVTLQLAFLAALLAFLAWALRDVWADAAPRLRDADVAALGIALALLAAYYLAFVVGWQWILRAVGIRVSYSVALQAEMASMLAKYIPGGVWTPAARVVWLRRAGRVEATSVVVSSILLEAGLSAVAGVLVFLGGLLWVDGEDAPLVPLIAFTAVVATLLHPRVFGAIAKRVFAPFGGAVPPPLRWRTALGLLAYYSLTWLIGGAALLFLLRSVGGDPSLATIPFLGGVGAVGAIVAVLSILAPSGLGVREATMYGLMLAVASPGVALGASVLNRLSITVVEALLLAAGIAVWRLSRAGAAPRPVPTGAER
jgi:glycosyltransferase 2 family protein